MKADLHCHSTFSDGVFTPHEIVLFAKKRQFDAVALTDHDTFSGYFELKKYAHEEGLMHVTGIEISSVFDELSVHILGYGFSPESEAIHSYEKWSQGARRTRARKIVQKLQACGVLITEEEVFREERADTSIGRPHIARILVQKNYGKSLADIFEAYLGDKRQAYIPSERISAEEAVHLIHDAGGLAFIAHPHLYRKKKSVLQLLDRFPFDGLEGLYGRFGERENEYWIRLAHERKLLISGGSDFHGDTGDDGSYGSSLAPEETVRLLWNHMMRG